MEEKRNSSYLDVFSPNQERVSNQIQDERNDLIFEQNKYLKELAEASKQSAIASEKSSKHSKICAYVSLGVSVLMLIATIVSICVG